MLYSSPSVYQSLIEDKKVADIIDELNCHAHRTTERFHKLCEALFEFEEVDNEMNRITGKFKLDGAYYISALLYYVAVKGWAEPVKRLVQLGADIRLVMLYDDVCKKEMIAENVSHFFHDIKITF